MQTSIDYEIELNEPQYEAVFTKDGPVLVIAGAGSGKTRTLVYRVARLVESGVQPESILLLTFTRKAASEMMERASQLLDVRCKSVSGGTFHSTANYILRRYGELIEYPNFTIIDRGDSAEVIGYIAGEMGLKRKEIKLPRKTTIIDIISKAINKSLSIPVLLEKHYPHLEDLEEIITELAGGYHSYKKERRLMDYDDLLL
jgi:DNA helicase-2/ATP-dependent DNA helicase PcrA